MNGKGDRNRSDRKAYQLGWERIFGKTQNKSSGAVVRKQSDARRRVRGKASGS